MNFNDKKIKLLFMVLGICIGIFIVFYQVFDKEPQGDLNLDEELALETESNLEPVSVEEAKNIFVDIKGAVHNEGVYEAREGMRVKDIVDLAGGFIEEAEVRQVNMAERVEDEMVIYVPRIGEELTEVDSNTISDKAKGKVSLNKATQEEFETLSGIGPSKAAAIISYREENGPFKKLEDLMQVSGIGEKSFEKIKDSLKLN
ncbi:helix-hairpin-helix domain-containing protein [Bacillus nitroreducens]